MDDNKNIPMEDEEVTILTLHDDEGNEEQFELLDLVDYQDKQYIGVAWRPYLLYAYQGRYR